MRRFLKISANVIIGGLATVVGLITVFGIGADWRAYTVQGGSMEPHYRAGDLIVTSATNVRNVEPGHIIVFTADWASEQYERRVVHRVAAVGTIDGRPFAFTRGDANTRSDPEPVDLTSNVAVVRFSLPAGGFWPQLLAGPLTIVALAILGAVVAGTALSAGVPLSSATFRHLRRGAQHRRALAPSVAESEMSSP